jgi:17beta-estradiol 17-dehydrogenase / very-long-chain 3-oxoacyl-CoA reductase
MIDTILSIFWYYTLYLVLKHVVLILYFFYRHYIRPSKDLKSRYGLNSWVLVTGATDGIGKGLALSFAKLGFNIVLVSRTKSKLDAVADEIKKATEFTVEIKCIEFDFTKRYTLEQYKESFQELYNYDLSILINNVGWTEIKLFEVHTGQAIQDHINVNVVPQAILTAMFLKQLASRSGKKSAIINLSSFASMVQTKKFITYNAVKTFNNTHSKLVHYELGHSIDSISIKPMWVETPLSKTKENWINCISVDTLCEAILKQMGYDIETFGAARHEWQANLLLRLPNFLLKFRGMRSNFTY